MTGETLARSIVEEFDAKYNPPDKITEPTKGQIVLFKAFMDNVEYRNGKESKVIYRKGEEFKVKIKRGQYFSNGRLSNFWYFNRVDDNNNIVGEELHGYGNFYKVKEE